MATTILTEEKVQFEYRKGNISSTKTIEKEYMTITKAMSRAIKIDNCIGFSLESSKKPNISNSSKEYLIHFKEGEEKDIQDYMTKWHTYLCPININNTNTKPIPIKNGVVGPPPGPRSTNNNLV